MSQTFFHLIFVIAFVVFTAIRMYYHRMAQRTAGKVTYIEGRLNTLLRMIFGFPYIILLAVYMFRPSILEWATVPVPEWAQWVGAVLALAVLPLILWVQWALGSNFSTRLHVRDEHTLVTKGPYRWVRHPMYTIFFFQAVGFCCLPATCSSAASTSLPSAWSSLPASAMKKMFCWRNSAVITRNTCSRQVDFSPS